MVKVSVIIPCYKRVEQTVKSIKLILASKGIGSDFELEVIAGDSTPDDSLKNSLIKEFAKKIVYTRPEKPGVAANKNQGAKIAKGDIFIFCDSDMEVEGNTLSNTVKALKKHQAAGGIGGQVLWRGGANDGSIDRPRKEDRMVKIEETVYIEALYSRYFATYKETFLNVGGYDQEVFNMRGEGSDLSIRYWRAGYPLVYEESIIVHHVYDVPDSVALRTTHPEWAIAKDLLLLGYKYDLLDDKYQNFMKTVEENFKQFGSTGYFRIIEGLGNYFDFITQMKPIIDKEKAEIKSLYDFKFLEVFSQKNLFEKCIAGAEGLLKSARTKLKFD